MKKILKPFLFMIVLILLSWGVKAQTNDAEEEKSWVLAFVENQISTPDRQIRLYDIEGTLSSQASIGEITIADRQGIWLRIIGAKIDWNRSSLLLGRLSINELSAAHVQILRKPLSESDGLPDAAANRFTLPQLPIAVEIGRLSSPLLTLGEPLFGRASRLSLDGHLTLGDGDLDAAFIMKELDRQGKLSLIANYTHENNAALLDFNLEEPENGIVANGVGLEGHPPVRLRVFGEGVLDKFEITLAATIDGKRLASGSAFLEKRPQGHAFGFELAAKLTSILPEAYHDFFGVQTSLAFVGSLSDQGDWQMEDFIFHGGKNVFLEGQGSVDAQGVWRKLIVNGQLMAQNPDQALILPVKGGDTQLEKLEISIAYDTANLPAPGAPIGRLVIANLFSTSFSTKGAKFDFYQTSLTGAVAGFKTGNPALDRRFFTNEMLEIEASLEKHEGLRKIAFDIKNPKLAFSGLGTLDEGLFDGAIQLAAQDALALEMQGKMDFLSGAFDWHIKGKLHDLSLRNPLIDRLLTRNTQVSGKIKRDEKGLHFDALEWNNNALNGRIQGHFSSQDADLDIGLNVLDMDVLDEHLAGGMQIKASLKGHSGFITLAARGRVETGSVLEKPLQEITIDFNGFLDSRPYQQAISGQMIGGGQVDGKALDLSADLDLNGQISRFDNLFFKWGDTQLSGDFAAHKDGLFEGVIEATKLQLGRYPLERLLLKSRPQADASHLEIVATSVEYGQIEVTALLQAAMESWELMLQQARLYPMLDKDIEGVEIRLGAPTKWILASDGKLHLGMTKMQLADASLSFSGEMADEWALDLQLDSLPLDMLKLVAPNVQVQGEVSGSLQISGALQAPDMRFDLIGTGINHTMLQRQGVADVSLQAQGVLAGDILELKADMTGKNKLKAQMQGRIMAFQTLDMAVHLDNLPLEILAGPLKAQNLTGRVTGQGHIDGQLSSPQAEFTLEAANISSALLIENGLAPFQVRLAGRFANQIFTLEPLSAQGPQGLHFNASGILPVSGHGLDLRLSGDVPLGLANRFLAKRGAQLSGLLTLETTLSGSLLSPQFGGNFTVVHGQFIDPPSNARLNNITLSGSLAGENITFTHMQASSANGGSVHGQGTISANIVQGLPAAINLRLEHMRYYDGVMMATTLDGDMSITGALLRDFELGGQLLIERMEINVPNLASQAQDIEVRHENISQVIATTLERAQIETRTRPQIPVLQRDISPRLNLEIRSPARIFVRGRGLDSELGGIVHLKGTFDAPKPVGSFNLIRGRFDILTKRLELEEGRIALSGTLDPDLYFIARTQGNGIDVSVTLRGTLDDLNLTFASQPFLPQDEVLAFLIFNRSLSELSPLQIAQLAASAAELTGITGPSLMSRLRDATGLDDLDVTSDGQGNTGVRAGRYIRDNVYLGVEADNQGQTRGSINLDITRHLKAKGSIGSDSNSSVGVFYEKDY